MRRDAVENRLRLLNATRQVLRELGADAPLETITEQAGLTRGTLYRNFQDRAELYKALLDHEVELIRRDVDALDACGLFEVMRKLIDISDIYVAYASAVQGTTTPVQACSPADLLEQIIHAPLAAARAQGVVRASLTPEEVLLACRMVAEGWRLDGAPNRETAIDRRLLLIIRGLTTNPDIPAEKDKGMA